MSKKQGHTGLYMTPTEWKAGGYTNIGSGHKKAEHHRAFKKLPFDCCAITLSPFDDPMCDSKGNCYEISNIVPFLKKYHRNPVTGAKMTGKDLIRLHFHKNKEGKYHCPATFSTFNENSYIVAIKTTGNVYSHEAVKELCIKSKSWKDLIDSSPFVREDIITLQDPHNIAKESVEIDKFFAQTLDGAKSGGNMNEKVKSEGQMARTLKMAREMQSGIAGNQMEGGSFSKGLSGPSVNRVGVTATDRALEMVREKRKKEEEEARKKAEAAGNAPAGPSKPQGPLHAYSTGKMAASFTSTAQDLAVTNDNAEYTADELRERIHKRVKKNGKKGYVAIKTNKGSLNVELHCDKVPKTCDNFMQLCAKGYYDGTKFHRLIKNFMIQGGDPTGTGTGGESIWGKPFNDEFHVHLKHDGRGVLSMANSGPHSNKSQFFICFKSCEHLNDKHSVFGKVVGQLDTLKRLEDVETDRKDHDKPMEELIIESTQIFVNPYEVETQKQAEEEEEARKKAEDDLVYKEELGSWFSNPAPQSASGTGVGKYLREAQQAAAEGSAKRQKKW